MTRLLLAAMLLPASLLACPAARAQGAPPATPQSHDVYEMQCSLFRHNTDGTWSSAQPMTLQPASGPIPLKPTYHIRPGTLFAGFDLAKALDGACMP